jgi:hypothetical protein
MVIRSGKASRACPLCGDEDAPVIVRIRADRIVSSNPYYGDAACERPGVAPDATYAIAGAKPVPKDLNPWAHLFYFRKV